MEDFIKRFGEQAQDGTWFLSTSRQSTITSLLAAGTFFGSILQAFLADLQRFGRKGSIFFWSAVFVSVLLRPVLSQPACHAC
jgi:SP family sugar:H+ symporter-like MFS transporter